MIKFNLTGNIVRLFKVSMKQLAQKLKRKSKLIQIKILYNNWTET